MAPTETSSEPQPETRAVLPPPPKLWNQSRNRAKRVPLQVFGWPITMTERQEWADRFQISNDIPQYNRIDRAWRQMCSLLPRKAKRCTLVEYSGGKGTIANCIFIGSNKDERELQRARDEELILEVSNLLQMQPDHDSIEPQASERLDRAYRAFQLPSTTTDVPASTESLNFSSKFDSVDFSSSDSQDVLILNRNAVPFILSALDLPEDAKISNDLYRALDQIVKRISITS